jgi:glycerol-3-phosphate O-acyltransferase
LSNEVYDVVFSYPKLVARFAKYPDDQKRAVKLVDEIKGDFSPTVVRSLTNIIDVTFLRLYEGINLQIPHHIQLLELMKTHHVVLVPNHQSHADYIALTYSVFKKFEIPVYVAGGINLNIFPIGAMFRKAGAFYIRRSFNNDQLYRIVFEAYIYFLLKKGLLVEFFFEGGRTRTGKLMPPRFGLFQMLIEAQQLVQDGKKLMFIPVSLAHEHIPEEKAHARELAGGKKDPEKTTQLFKLFKLFSKKLGTIHVRFGEPIVPEEFKDIKLATQTLAFDCFKSVGKGMPITPSALLALILLDEPSGALTWKQIEDKATEIIDYCLNLNIPLTPSLQPGLFQNAVKSSLDLFIGAKKVVVIQREKLNQVFYAIKPSARVEVLFHKNMILHHFIVPGIINATWFNIFNGQIKDQMQLARYLQVKRKELKYEFYLPSVREMIYHALDIMSYALGRKVTSIDEALHFSSQELYQIAAKVRHFSTAFSYIYEAYYTSAITIKYLAQAPFNNERFIQVARELFSLELEHGRVVKYPESFAVPILKDTLYYLENLKVLEKMDGGQFRLVDPARLDALIEKFIRDLNDQVTINLKFNRNSTSL